MGSLAGSTLTLYHHVPARFCRAYEGILGEQTAKVLSQAYPHFPSEYRPGISKCISHMSKTFEQFGATYQKTLGNHHLVLLLYGYLLLICSY